jgi:hypothetical protein
VSFSTLAGPDRRPQAVTLRVSLGGLVVDVDPTPDAPALLLLAQDLITAAEAITVPPTVPPTAAGRW